MWFYYFNVMTLTTLYCTGIENVGEFCSCQGSVRELAFCQGNVREKVLSGKTFIEQNMYLPQLFSRILAMDRTQNDIKFVAASGFY